LTFSHKHWEYYFAIYKVIIRLLLVYQLLTIILIIIIILWYDGVWYCLVDDHLKNYCAGSRYLYYALTLLTLLLLLRSFAFEDPLNHPHWTNNLGCILIIAIALCIHYYDHLQFWHLSYSLFLFIVVDHPSTSHRTWHLFHSYTRKILNRDFNNQAGRSGQDQSTN